MERRPPVGSGAQRRGRLMAARSHGTPARERRPPVGTAPHSGANRVSPIAKNRRDGLERRPPVGSGAQRRGRLMAARSHGTPARERRPPVGTAPRSGAKPRIADSEESRERLGTPTSGRHRGAQRRGRLMAARSHGTPARERRPPVGTAPRSGAKPRIADSEESRGRLGTPTSGRHSGPKARGGRDPNRRDGSLLGAYPSRAGWRATAGPHRENWPPVSDRHRAGARNLR